MTAATTGPLPATKSKRKTKAKRKPRRLPVYEAQRPLETAPVDYDFAKHAALGRKDFANAALWAQHQAVRMAWRAERASVRADAMVAKQKDDATWGDVATIRAVKRLRSALADLKALGVDMVKIASELAK